MTPPLVLVPGHWLGGWAWDEVAAALQARGDLVAPVTLPGLESAGAGRAGLTLEDHVRALLAVVDRLPHPVVLVAHSGGGVVATVAADRVPHQVRRLVFVDSGPHANGRPYDPDLDPHVVEVPLPSWEDLRAGGVSLDGLDDDRLATFRERAVPHPAGPLREPVALTSQARPALPVTEVCASFTGSQVREMLAAGVPMFQPLADYADVTYVDLPTGHWPMWSRPDDLADVLHAEAARP
jgi:pimeloyl-ACP methyl ester carboxylesterase